MQGSELGKSQQLFKKEIFVLHFCEKERENILGILMRKTYLIMRILKRSKTSAVIKQSCFY